MLSLWKNREFMKMWSGQTISIFGSQITLLALPLTATATLQASALQMGILRSLEYAPFLLAGLFAGVWIDRMRKRPLMISADLGRAVLFGCVPLLAFAGQLRMEALYVIAFLAGILTTFYAIAYQSFLPQMLSRDLLVEGNGKMELSRSVAELSGPGIAGLLVQWLSGVFAILINAVTFVVSALFLLSLSVSEPVQQIDKEQRKSIWSEIGEGLTFIFGNRYLRSIAGCSATINFFTNMVQAVFILYINQELGLEPAVIGTLILIGSSGAVVSAFFSNKIIEKFGIGAVIVGSAFFEGFGGLLFMTITGKMWFVILMICLAQFFSSLAATIYNISQISFRQSITDPLFQGRMNATMRFVVWGAIPFGALAGGLLGAAIGLYPTIAVGSLGGMLSFLWVYFSPVRSVSNERSELFV